MEEAKVAEEIGTEKSEETKVEAQPGTEFKLLCEDISEVDEADKSTFEEILKNFWINNRLDGVAYALAATQIGLPVRMFIVRNKKIPDLMHPKAFITITNPIMSIPEDAIQLVYKKEGCLSYPEARANTLRYDKVIITCKEFPDGMRFKGIWAVVMQHEIDHMIGKTMFMHETDLKRNKFERNKVCPCGSGKKYKQCCESLHHLF